MNTKIMNTKIMNTKIMNTKIKTIGIVFLSIIGMLLLFISIVGIGNYFQENINKTAGNLILMSFSVIVYFAVIFFNKKINKLSARDIGFYFNNFIKNSLLGIGLAVGTTGIVLMVASVFFEIQFEFISLKDGFEMALLSLFSTFLIIGFWEEFYFRGLVFNTLLKNKFGFHLSAILSALLFSIVHFGSFDMSTTSWFWYIGIIILGYILAYLYSYTKSIWSVVFFHWFWNMLVTLMDASQNEIGLFQITNYTEYSTTIDNIEVVVLSIILIIFLFLSRNTKKNINAYITGLTTNNEMQKNI